MLAALGAGPASAQDDLATLTIHHRWCPAGYAGPDYFGTCHDAPLADWELSLRGAEEPKGRTDAQGNLTFAGLTPGAYTVFGGGGPADFVTLVVFCAPAAAPGAEFPATSEPLRGGPGQFAVELALGPGDEVICDFSVIPADLSAPSDASDAVPAAASPVPASECPMGEREPAVEDLFFRDATPRPGLFPQPTPKPDGWTAQSPRVTRAALPDGSPAAPEAVAGIRATLRQLGACSNAMEGGERLYSDDYFRRTAVGERGGWIVQDVALEYPMLAFLDDAPEPAIERAWLLPDGRIGAIVVPRDMAPLFLAFVRDPATGRYLVDEVANLIDEGTPVPDGP